MAQEQDQEKPKPKTYFDKKDQHDRIAAYIIEGERLAAFFDCKGRFLCTES